MKNNDMHAAIRELGTLWNEGAVGMLSDGQLLDRFVERRDASADAKQDEHATQSR